ncbi:MAG: AMP-binding protein [Chloroflexi bacterium]|nr:AMP-binding protein [Chloroflexota bacterium]
MFNVGQLLRRAAERKPTRAAMVWEDGQRTYGELLRRVDRLSGAFAALRVQAGDRVAILFHNGPEFVESWWAAVQMGAVAVPLSTRALPDELQATVSDAEAAAVIAGPEFLETLADLRKDLPSVRAIVGAAERPPSGVFSYEDLLGGPDVEPPRANPKLGDACAIYYTAGTTGASKGAVRSHLSVSWGLGMLAARLRADDVSLARAPMYHTGGSLTGPFASLAAGVTLVSLRQFDARTLLETVERHGITRLYLHPTLVANAIFEELERRPYTLDSLRCLQWTAGALPDSVRTRILERFTGLPLETTYGMTEVSNIASYEYVGGPIKPANCVGYGLPGTLVRILDEAGQPQARGRIGEIAVSSPTAMSGYWRDQESTAHVLVDGWVHTGDLGHLDEDGHLLLEGRQKDAIVTAGETVHASEVERVLCDLPGVVEAAVVGLPDPKWGEAVSAVLVADDSARLDEAAIIAACHQRLPGYKCPKRVIVAENLPKSAVGKVLKRDLVARYGGGQ